MAKPQSPDVVTAHPQPSSLCRTASPCSVRVHATIRSDCSPCSSPCAQSCTTPAAEVTQPAAVTMTDASVASQGRRSPSCTSTPSECCVHATVDVRSYCHVPPGHLPARQCQHTSPSGEGASTVSWQPKHLAQEARQCDASGSQQLHQDGADNQKGMLSPAVQQCLGMNRPHLQHCAHQSSGGNILPSVHQEPCAATRASHMYRTQRSVTRHRVSASVVREAKRVMREMSSSNSDDENQHGDSRAKHPLEAGNKGGLSFEQKSSESSCAARASVLCAVCHSPVEVTIRQSPSPTQQLELGCNLSPGKRSRAEKIKKMSSELHGLKDRSKKVKCPKFACTVISLCYKSHQSVQLMHNLFEVTDVSCQNLMISDHNLTAAHSRQRTCAPNVLTVCIVTTDDSTCIKLDMGLCTRFSVQAQAS